MQPISGLFVAVDQVYLVPDQELELSIVPWLIATIPFPHFVFEFLVLPLFDQLGSKNPHRHQQCRV
jgi:hypothetical protein